MSAPVELPMALPVAAQRSVATINAERYRELAARVKLPSWPSLGVMSIEVCSAIEGYASVIISLTTMASANVSADCLR
jgi:hypothetical protein